MFVALRRRWKSWASAPLKRFRELWPTEVAAGRGAKAKAKAKAEAPGSEAQSEARRAQSFLKRVL